MNDDTENKWIAVEDALPADGVEVETCVLLPEGDNLGGDAVIKMVLLRTLWWKPDQTVMAVNTPTHWRACAPVVDLGAFNPLMRLLAVPENGTIVVAGAYQGDYLHYFSERFPTAQLVGFEPQREAFLKAKTRMEGRKAILLNHGLATATRIVWGGKHGSDGCSTVSIEGDYQVMEMMDVVATLHSIGRTIDLLVLNCEGSEWALLPYLMDEMMHHRIAAMAVQFHPEYVSSERAARVRALVMEYYDEAYADYPAWVYYTRKGI